MQPLLILYRNHRGEVSWRSLAPRSSYFGCTEWHPEKQWLLEAWDLDRDTVRTFAWRDILYVSVEPHRLSGEQQDAIASLALRARDEEERL